MPDPDREIYANAPLSLVAFELRFPRVPGLEKDRWEEVYGRMREDFPILGPPPESGMRLTARGPQPISRGVRLLNRERTRGAVILEEAVVLEASAYHRYEEFMELAESLVQAVDEVGSIPGVERLGLRYIDEIVVPGTDPEWGRYIAESLLAPVQTFADLNPKEHQGSLELESEHGNRLSFRYGALREPVVDPEGPLRIPESPKGEYFLIDLDSFWAAPEEALPEFEMRWMLERSEELHEPIRMVFERSIRDELRELMREERSQ